MLAFLLRVMARREELNVTVARREMGIRRTLFCRWRRRSGGSVNRCVKRVQAATPSATLLTFAPSL